MRAVGSGFISVLRPSERLSVLQGVLRCATLRWRRGRGSVVAGGPSVTDAGIQRESGDDVRVSYVEQRGREEAFIPQLLASGPTCLTGGKSSCVGGWMHGWMDGSGQLVAERKVAPHL